MMLGPGSLLVNWMTRAAACWETYDMAPYKDVGTLLFFGPLSHPPPPPHTHFLVLPPSSSRTITSYATLSLNLQTMPCRTLPSFTLVVSSRRDSFPLPDYYRTTRVETYGPYYRQPEPDLMVRIRSFIVLLTIAHSFSSENHRSSQSREHRL